jgi:dGTPase
MFTALERRYIENVPPALTLLAQSDEESLAAAASPSEKARILCDVISRMTDGQATRTYKRLFEADFGSIVDLV